MAKFTKEETQKIVLSGMMFVALIYCYFEFLLKPMDRKKTGFAAQTVKIEKDTGVARGTVQKYRNLVAEADKAGEILLQIDSMIPDGAPVAWFPPKVKAFFDQHGLENAVVSQTGATPLEGDAGAKFRKMTWAIEIPKADFVRFGIALAGFENNFPLVRVTNLDISPIEDEPTLQTIKLNCLSIFKP